jgi:hypothetical protein
MNKPLKILFLISAVIFLSSCNINKDSDPYYKISDQFKQYCMFQKQSTWTYQNDSDKSLHDLTIQDVNAYIGFHAESKVSKAYSYDIVDMFYDTTVNDGIHIIKGSINAGDPDSANGQMNDLYWLFFSNQNYLLAFAPGYPMGVEQRLGTKPGLYTNVKKLANFTLNGKDYSDVYHTQVRKTEGTPDTVTYEFYFAPHFGLIKWTRRVYGKTTSYSLKQSNLIQK